MLFIKVIFININGSKGNRLYPNKYFLAATLRTCLVCATPYSLDDEPSVSLGQASHVYHHRCIHQLSFSQSDNGPGPKCQGIRAFIS